MQVEVTNVQLPLQIGEFDWDTYTQGIILGAFFYGYVITQLPGGRIAEVLGAKWMFGLGVFLTAVLTLAIPVASRAHYGGLIAIRVLQGLGEVRIPLRSLKLCMKVTVIVIESCTKSAIHSILPVEANIA